MDKKVSAKRNGKWWTYGSLKVDHKYGNLRLSFKNSAELKELVNSDAEWLNFSLFDREEKSEHNEAKANGYQRDNLDDDQSIPF